MAVGDLLILANDSNTAAVPNASTLDAIWPSLRQAFGLSAGNAGTTGRITLAAGRYLIVYSEYFNTTNTTNNERIEIVGSIHTVAGGVQGGYGQGFIRKSSGDQDCAVRGSMILELASQQDVFIQFERTDDSTSGTVNRVTGLGQVAILQLDTTHNYGMYSRSTTQSTSGTAVLTYGIDTNDVQDTGFSRSGSVVTVTNAGRYLVSYSIRLNQTATGREDIISYLTDNGTELRGTRGFCYLRGADGTQDGALTWIGVLDLAANAQIDLRVQCPTSATINLTDGMLQLWQLPAGADTVIVEATTGNYNTNGNFTWDTVPHIDTDEFTASGATDTVTLDNGNAFLAFATLSQFAPDTPQRAVPRLQFELDGSLIEGVGDAYHRNSGGTGAIAITVASAFFAENASATLRTNITVTAAAGTLTNDNAQWSVISLASIFGAYIPPPAISDVDGDNQLASVQNNVVLNGFRFGAIQGTGKVELWDDLAGTTKVVQTIDTWSDTSIQFDFDRGAIADDATRYIVVTTDSAEESVPFGVFVGIPPLEDFFDVMAAFNFDHLWRFDNDGYADQEGTNPVTAIVFGNGGAFVAEPITMQNTHSWRLNDQANSGRRETANSAFMNTATLQTRTMGGWIRLGAVDPALSCIYEEGGGVNNVCFLLGMGNILIASYADTGDDNAQAYSDFPLDPNRDYFIVWRFDHTKIGDERRFELIIDGVLQSVTSGNPLTSGNLDSHSGDITFGGQGSNLEVGGTDVAFRAQLDTKYAQWFSSRVFIENSDLLDIFQKGALPRSTIVSDTPANMQTAVNALTQARDNEALDIRIFNPSSGVEDDLALDFDGIVFNERTSIQLEWRGAGTLTITNLNGANLDAAKTLTLRGGNVQVVNPATLTLTGLENPTEVRVYEAGTQTEVAGQEDVTTGTFTASIQVNTVDIVIHALGFLNQRIEGVDMSGGDVALPITPRVDRQYDNP